MFDKILVFSRYEEPIPTEVLFSAPPRPQSCGKISASSFDDLGFSAWLRGKFPNATSANVETLTGIPAATVENWLQRRSRPTVEYFALLAEVFGPSLLSASLTKSVRWVEKAVAAERAVQIDEQIALLIKERDQVLVQH